MGMPRTPVSAMSWADKNIKRSLSYSATRKAVLAHRAELEQMWQDLSERRADALAEIKRDGLTVRKSDGCAARYLGSRHASGFGDRSGLRAAVEVSGEIAFDGGGVRIEGNVRRRATGRDRSSGDELNEPSERSASRPR